MEFCLILGKVSLQFGELYLILEAMITIIFALVGFAMGLCVLYWLFYGIIVLVFQPQESSLSKLTRMSLYLLLGIIVFVVCVLLTNSFLARTNLYHLQFSFGDIFRLIGQWLQRRFQKLCSIFMKILVNEAGANQRFDRFLRKWCKSYPEIRLSDIYSWIRKGVVTVNGRKSKEEYRLKI